MPIANSPKLTVILKWAVVFAVVVLAAQGGRLLHFQIKDRTDVRAAQVPNPSPYTVTLREIIHRSNGTTRVSRDIIQAVRSDGATVERSSSDKGSGRSLYFSSGLQVGVNELHKTKTSMMKPEGNPAISQRDASSKCLNSLAGKRMTSSETLLGEEMIAGYRTVKIASGIVTEWHALDYGCALVRDRWEFSATEVTEKELVALVAGEPDANLFDVPATYREIPPSEETRPCNENAHKFLQMLDEDYKRYAAKPVAK